MNQPLTDIFPLVIISLTFVGTIITVYYTGKNIKTNKYIETITSERIKWLDTLRNEVTDIVTNIHFTLTKYFEKMEELNEYIDSNKDNFEAQYIAQNNFSNTTKDSAFGSEKNIWSQKDFIKQLNLLKLRLNPYDDKNIMEIIDYFILLYSEKGIITRQEINKANEKMNLLLIEAQNLLKKEWEKIKKETRGKI